MNPSVVKKTRLWMAGLLFIATTTLAFAKDEFSEDTCHIRGTRCLVIKPSPANLEALRSYEPLVPSRAPDDERALVDMTSPEWLVSRACLRTNSRGIITPQPLCARVRSQCEQEFGFNSCNDLRTYSLSWRFNSEKIRSHVFDDLVALASSTIANPDVRADCCRGFVPGSCEYKRCTSRFAETRLFIARYDPLAARPASTYFTAHSIYPSHVRTELRNSIVIDEASPIVQMTLGSLEQQLLHELGHACEDSNYLAEKICSLPEPEQSAADPAELDMEMNDCKKSLEPTKRHLERIAGKDTAECISSKLAAFAASRPRENRGERSDSACLGFWNQEAFADLIFIHRWRTLAHWARSCSTGMEWFDHSHAPQKIHFDCTLFDEKFMASLCDGAPPPRYPVETKKPEPEPATKKN